MKNSKISLIIFDLDNTLVDLSEMHRVAFTDALALGYGLNIDKDYHDIHLNGLPTKEKLKKLGVPESRWKEIIDLKQQTTLREIDKININYEQMYMIMQLGFFYKLYCASNSIRQTVEKVLKRLGISTELKFFGSDDVYTPKPSPEIYYKCMVDCGCKISETLIVEDSEVGEKAINYSGAHKLMVKNAADLTMDKLLNRIKEIENGIY